MSAQSQVQGTGKLAGSLSRKLKNQHGIAAAKVILYVWWVYKDLHTQMLHVWYI